jgi:3-methyladenine DNA glycosylase AlkC
MADVPPDVLARLNAGEIESMTLAEMLRVDIGALMRAVASDAGDDAPAIVASAGGVVQRMAAGGAVVLERLGLDALDRFATHRSDIVRGWAAYAIAAAPNLSLARRLKLVTPLADDPNAGVREWAWIAIRPHIAADVPGAIERLTPWTVHRSANLRRYASEITRPRGVWCAHIQRLKDDPAPGLALLEPLRADPTKYVQDSVANWLNDASKHQPKWVRAVCARWKKESATKETLRICTRAMRSM